MSLLLEATRLSMLYRTGGWPERQTVVEAVRSVDLGIKAGEHLGLVGESGSGKSTLARLLLLLQRPTSGTVRWRGEDLTQAPPTRIRRWRQEVQIIFQDPISALNPRLSVRSLLSEPLDNFGLAAKPERENRLRHLLHDVDLPVEFLDRRPRELSRGQAQRVVIARALATQPLLLVCDEPVSALDVSHQVQFVELLRTLASAKGLTYLLISHDLAVVAALCDRIAVMYQGRLVEIGPAAELRRFPRHPYTQLLMRSLPTLSDRDWGGELQLPTA